MLSSRSVRSTFTYFFSTVFGFIIAGSTYIAFYYEFFNDLEPDGVIAVSVIGIFALYFFIIHISTKGKWKRKSQYAEVFKKLNRGFKEIHRLDRIADEPSKEIVVQNFQKLCDYLASTYTAITDTNCSTCIKILKSSDNDVLAYETLCRNSEVDEKRLNADRKTKINDIKHTFSENTAFKEADHSDEGYFICNRLPFWVGYQNTSFQIFGKPYIGLNIFMRYWNWKLPYKSTIVVPIKPLHSDSTDIDSYGYLCVDSDKLGVFDHDFDTEIMKGVADGIYNTFIRLKHIV